MLLLKCTQAHRYNDEGPPGGMAVQLTGGASVKSHLPNDEQIIPQPFPDGAVASLLTAQGMDKAAPLPVASIRLL